MDYAGGGRPEARNLVLGMAMQNPKLQGIRPEGMEDNPQLRVDVDREKARALGIDISDINNTLTIALGSSYINDFVNQGKVQKVILQADAEARMLPEDIKQLRVRNQAGEMVPFSAFSDLNWTMGSPRLTRYNGVPSMKIGGQAAPGISSGEAMLEMEKIASQLPPGFSFEWSGASYEEVLSEAQAPALFLLSMLVVYLALAALYESWSIPVSVIFAIPLGILGSLAAVYMRGLPNDVFFKVGLITIIGLAAKNAILIVEFAKDEEEKGTSLIQATINACRMRLRPILMTSLAFTFGVLPLAISSGAGASSRQAIGTGVMGGMIAATILAIIFVPVFYKVIRRWLSRTKLGPPTPSE